MQDQDWKDRDDRPVAEDGSSGISPTLIGLVVAAIVAVIFIVQNREDTSIDLLFWTFDTAVWVAIVIALILGALLGWLGQRIVRRRRK
ncbi:MAG: lipopolysaccharide assembly LapA domain-containing protein [Desertimonas sp.]